MGAGVNARRLKARNEGLHVEHAANQERENGEQGQRGDEAADESHAACILLVLDDANRPLK